MATSLMPTFHLLTQPALDLPSPLKSFVCNSPLLTIVRYSCKTSPPLAPPIKIAESHLFPELRGFSAKETPSFTFASVDHPHRTRLGGGNSGANLSLALRWNLNDATMPARRANLAFPFDTTAEGDLAQLIPDIQPRAFGKDDKDAYHETYQNVTVPSWVQRSSRQTSTRSGLGLSTPSRRFCCRLFTMQSSRGL